MKCPFGRLGTLVWKVQNRLGLKARLNVHSFPYNVICNLKIMKNFIWNSTKYILFIRNLKVIWGYVENINKSRFLGKVLVVVLTFFVRKRCSRRNFKILGKVCRNIFNVLQHFTTWSHKKYVGSAILLYFLVSQNLRLLNLSHTLNLTIYNF